MATVGTTASLTKLPVGQKIVVRGKRLSFFYVKTNAGWVQESTFNPRAFGAPLGLLAGVNRAAAQETWTDAEMMACIERVSTRSRPIAELCP